MNFPEAGFLCNKGSASGRDDFEGENVGIEEVVGFFEVFVCKPEDVEAGSVAVDEFWQFGRKCSRPPFFYSFLLAKSARVRFHRWFDSTTSAAVRGGSY